MDTDSTSNACIASDRVVGTAVYNAAGDKLGSIEKLMIDKRSGQVRFAVLEFGGFLGMGTDYYPVPWSMLDYDTSKDGFVAPLTKDQLDKAPRHGRDDRQDYDSDYSRSVHGYYGVKD